MYELMKNAMRYQEFTAQYPWKWKSINPSVMVKCYCIIAIPGTPLVTWFHFNPRMDK